MRIHFYSNLLRGLTKSRRHNLIARKSQPGAQGVAALSDDDDEEEED